MANIDPHTATEVYVRDLEFWVRGGAGPTNRHSRKMYRAMLRMVREHPARMLDATIDADIDTTADKTGQVWVWSDLHFGHDNIIRYTNRPFVDADEMDAALYANWLRTVGENDTLLFIGDLAMRRAVSNDTWQRVRRGAGKVKHLVLGNHDLTGSGKVRVDGFDLMSSLVCIKGDPPIVCTHLPLATLPDGWVNVHGHTHDALPRRSPHINVSVEQLDYAPVALRRLQLLARELVSARYPPGKTTLERLASIGV